MNEGFCAFPGFPEGKTKNNGPEQKTEEVSVHNRLYRVGQDILNQIGELFKNINRTILFLAATHFCN